MQPDNPLAARMQKLYTIPIPFKLISKSNHKTKGGHIFLSSKHQVFEDSVARIAFATCRKPRLENGWCVIRPHFKNKVHIDLVNIQKSLIDGLVKGGVFSDDKYIACTVVPAVYGDEHSEVEIWA